MRGEERGRPPHNLIIVQCKQNIKGTQSLVKGARWQHACVVNARLPAARADDDAARRQRRSVDDMEPRRQRQWLAEAVRAVADPTVAQVKDSGVRVAINAGLGLRVSGWRRAGWRVLLSGALPRLRKHGVEKNTDRERARGGVSLEENTKDVPGPAHEAVL